MFSFFLLSFLRKSTIEKSKKNINQFTKYSIFSIYRDKQLLFFILHSFVFHQMTICVCVRVFSSFLFSCVFFSFSFLFFLAVSIF